MNRKGFTLIELIATLLVLSLVVGITIYSVSGIFKDAKDKTEDVFIEKEKQAEEKIKNLLDKKKLDDPEYYHDFYMQLMYTDSDKEEFEELNKNMDVLSQNVNAFFDKVDEILLFLEKNDSLIEYKEEMIYFHSEQILNEYKKHLSELDEVANKIKVEEEKEEADSL